MCLNLVLVMLMFMCRLVISSMLVVILCMCWSFIVRWLCCDLRLLMVGVFLVCFIWKWVIVLLW